MMSSVKKVTRIRRLLAVIAVLGVSLAVSSTGHASPQYGLDCTSCHTMPPKDSGTAKKVPATGAVPGNHQKHASAQVASCVVCHGPGVTGYLNAHRNGTIELSDALGYSRRVAGFLNQTSVPPTPLGSCSAAACHSNGKGVVKATPDWADPAPATCSTCHDSAPLSGSHSKHITAYSYGCVKCHSDHAAEALPFQHATSAGKRAIDVRFSAAPNSGGSFSAGQCSSTYCHSNGQGGAPNVAATWGASVNCAGCHGSATSTGAAALSAKHASHVNNAAILGTNYGCKECHAATVSSDTTISDPASHVNGSVLVSGTKVGTVSNHTCATSYCHSNGKGAQGSVSWTQSATLGCNGCHGTSNATGTPDYANGGAGSAAANSHGKHVAGAADCVNCHSKSTASGSAIIAGSQHIDGFINYTAGNGKSFAKGANKTCSNISCHSGNGIVQNVAAAQWGATLNCQGCHSTLSAGHTAHTGVYGCVSCHLDSVVDNVTVKAGGGHMNSAINVAGAKIATFTLADQSCATSCHSGSTVPKWNVAASGACGTCHAVTAPLINTNAHAAHFTATYGPKLSQDVNGCAVCHLYGGERSATHVDGVANLNAGFAANGACSGCHRQATTQWGSVGTVTCQSCHTGAGSAINGVSAAVKDLAATSGHGKFGQDCLACHDKTSAHIGVAGGTDRLIGNLSGNAACDSCHLNAAKVSAASFNMRAHQPSGVGSQCGDCHDAHGTVNLRMVNGTINATAVSYTGTTTFANGAQTGVCQVCHTTTKYFTKAGVAAQTHVDSTTNCLDCHKHNPDSGLAFVPNGTCDACHGYPPAPRKLLAGQTLSFGVQGNWSSARFEDYSGGGGAHLVAAHLLKTAKPSDGWAPCLSCHNGGPALHQRVLPVRSHLENVSVKVDPQYRFSNDTFISYTGEKLVSGGGNKSGSCFNVSCHFKPSPQWSIER